MKETTINGKRLLFVPDGQAQEGTRYFISGTGWLCARYYGRADRKVVSEAPLPPGSWQLVGLSTEITESQWQGIVETARAHSQLSGTHRGAYNYETNEMIALMSATESGLSLIRSLGLTPPVAVLIQNEG